MSKVETRHLKKYFGPVKAVDDVDLILEEGEFLVLLGPSGSGKTTLMRLIAGLEAPTAGEILINEQVVNELPPRARGVAMVFQSYALYPHKTVYGNIAFPLRAQRVPKRFIAEKVAEAARMFEIGELLSRKPRQLSGGQRQRVALARAMVRQPNLFLFDEPLSNLDAKLRSSARAELRQFQRKVGTTTLYVTHDQVEAMGLGDRIAVMDKGKILQIGSPQQIYHEPANTFVATFVGSPPMNLLEHGPIWVGFRPESFWPRELHAISGNLINFSFHIHRVEQLGSDRLVYGALTGVQQDAKLIVISMLPFNITLPLQENKRYDFAVRTQDLKFFDRQTGQRLGPQSLPWQGA